MARRFAAVMVVALVVGCANDMHVKFSTAQDDMPTGTLVLLLSQPASDVTVAVNGVLVCESSHTQRVVVTGVPVGTAEVVVAANGIDKQFHAWVGTDHATTVPLGVPDGTMGFVKTLLGTVLTLVAYQLIHG